MKLMLVLGVRPHIIKSAPLICEASRRSEIELQIVHTGQHSSYEMSKIFFNELSSRARCWAQRKGISRLLRMVAAGWSVCLFILK